MSNIGILDPSGHNNNPLTEKPYSEEYKHLSKIWSKFPAYKRVTEIIKDIHNNQVILITAATGSGKTVLVPKYTLHALKYSKKIAITLPKQMITKSAAEFAAKTLDVNIGDEVGYQYRGSPKNTRSDKTKLLYATDGTIVAQLLKDPKLPDFDAVIIDEAHERKVQIDFLLYLLRETLKLRPTFKVIIMSATVNSNIFKQYFSNYKFKHLDIAGNTNYPIESIFIKETIPYKKALEEGFNILIKILSQKKVNTNENTDILFFVSSISEAHLICKKLSYEIKKEKNTSCKLTCNGDIYCIEMYSGMTSKNQELAQNKDLYKQNNNYSRKVVITTNVAESSLTVDGIKYVIDTGYDLSSTYDPEHRSKNLDLKLITHAQAKQRMGRSGRTEAGICYHMYAKQDFETNMDRFPFPDIKNSDISESCLKLLSLENIQTVGKLKKVLLEFIEPPDDIYINDAVILLTRLGVIESNKITKLGMLMSTLNTSPILALALIFSKVYNCSFETMKVLSLIETSRANIGKIFKKPNIRDKVRDPQIYKKNMELYQQSRKKFTHKYGDFHSLLKIYTMFDDMYRDNKEESHKWCSDHFLSMGVLIKSRLYFQKLKRRLFESFKEYNIADLNLDIQEEILKFNIDDRLLISLVIGYKTNTAAKRSSKHKDMYITQNSKELSIKIDRDSFLASTLPKHIIYHELFTSMGRSRLNIIGKITPTVIKLLD